MQEIIKYLQERLALNRLFGEVAESTFDWIRFANGEVSVQVNRKTIDRLFGKLRKT